MKEKALVYKLITSDSQDKVKVEEIYDEAFPDTEKFASIDKFLEIGEETGIIKIKAVYDEEQMAGFFVYIEKSEYVYILFFAVDGVLRGRGYGSRIIDDFLKAYSDKTVLACIETPIPGTTNYGQRLKRKAFYERANMSVTKYSIGTSDETMLTIISSRQDECVIAYFQDLEDTLINLTGSTGLAQGTLKYCLTENGKLREVTFEGWVRA